MRQATLVWSLWQQVLKPFASTFTRPSYRRFVEWVTALVLNVEEHTITQSVTAIKRVADWKALESFAEYAVWKPEILTGNLSKLIDKAPGRIWHGYRISAVDDTKVHRSGEHVGGTCTFHEYTARCPNRATTVRAHNWVCLGALLKNDGRPAWYLPISGRLYFRKSQLPCRCGVAGPKEVFRTKCELAVELLREQARIASGPHLGIFDGGYALKNVVRPLQAQDETVIGIIRFVQAVLIGQERSEDGTDLQEMIPVLGRSREPAEFQTQDQADVVQGDLSEQPLEAVPSGGGTAALPLILVDDSTWASAGT